MKEYLHTDEPCFYDGNEYKPSNREWFYIYKSTNGMLCYYHDPVEIYEGVDTLLFRDRWENSDIFNDEVILLKVNNF